MTTDAINFAEAHNIESVPAAIVFAAVYIPLLIWFTFQAFRRQTYVFFILSLFCAIRVATFTIRSMLTAVQSAGQNVNLVISDEVLASVGFFSLLNSAYVLVLDREKITNVSLGTGVISVLNGITGNKILFHNAVLAGVVLGILGSVQVSSIDPTKRTILRKISPIIFLVLIVILLYRCLLLYCREKIANREFKSSNESAGEKYGYYVLSVIASLLLIRQIFVTATMGSVDQYGYEDLWYAFVAVPELIAVVLFATPDLVPPHSGLPQ